MKWLKILALGSVTVLLILGITLFGLYQMIYTSFDDFQHDFTAAKQNVKLELFTRGYIKELSRVDTRNLYQNKCYRQCHGESAMITAVLSPAGWTQVVERMRVKENVAISGREADAIIKFLEEKYPTVTSAYSYEVRKKVHHAVWRNDVGQADIYTDVNYATREYLRSIGAEYLIEKYEIDKYYVFIVSFSVHEGELKLFDMDKVCFLRSPSGEIPTTPPWELRFQTADKHHFEGVVRFEKKGNPPIIDSSSKWFELVIKGLGGVKERVFHYDLPLVYPPEILTQEAELK